MNDYNAERNGSVRSMRFWRPRNERRTVIEMEQDPQDALGAAKGIRAALIGSLMMVAMGWLGGKLLDWW